MKKLSEIKTGEKFCYEGKFFIGIESVCDGDSDTFVLPIDLNTGRGDLMINPDAMVREIDGSWVIENGCNVVFGPKTVQCGQCSIIEKLEEIRCGVIDVESAIEKNDEPVNKHLPPEYIKKLNDKLDVEAGYIGLLRKTLRFCLKGHNDELANEIVSFFKEHNINEFV